jgi:hypothetical protein
MSARDAGAAVAQEVRLAKIRRLVAQASCLPSMLSAVEFVSPLRQEEMLIECQNFADDIGCALSHLLRPEPS